MASGNRVFRAKATYFLNGVKVAAGSLIREGHVLTQGMEAHLEELKIHFERDDLQAQKDAKVAADKAEADLKAKADADAKAAELAAAKAVEADAAKVVEADVKKAAN